MHFDDATKALVELAASRHNAFHSSEVADTIPARRLRRAEQRGELVRLSPRVWAVAALGHPIGQAVRAATLQRQGAAACHCSAAWLHRWVDRPPEIPQIWVPYSARTSAEGVSRHWCSRIDPAVDVVELEGIRTLSQAATLCLLGRAASPSFVERCLDDFTRTQRMSWLVQTLDRLWAPNCGGTTVLAKILGDPKRVDGITDSWMERLVANLVARVGVPEIAVQYPVSVGGRDYRLDVAVPSIKLGLEGHSRKFHWGPDREDADNVRDFDLAAAGWELLYITWSQLSDPDALVDRIARVAKARRALFA